MLFQQEVAGVPGILRRVFQAGDDGRHADPDHAGGLRRAGEIPRREAAADRHRQREGRGQGRGHSGQPRVPAGDRAVRRRHQRVLQVRRGVFPRARGRAEQGIPRDRRRRASWCRSTIRSCPTSSSSRASTTRRRSGARRSMSRPPTARCKGIPPEKVRFHTCYGINEGPRLYEAALVRHHRIRAEDQRRLATASRRPIRATSTSITCSSA